MTSIETDQEKIWDHFQNEGIESFSQNRGRLEFLAKKLKPSSRVLNIGVGNGAMESLAIARSVDIWSLDPSERTINRLRELLPMGERAKPGLSQAIPFQDSMFDVVVMSEVLEHLEDEVLKQTLTEVDRVLRNGGLFIGTVPARENLEESRVICPCCGTLFHRWGHQQRFDIERLSNLISSKFLVMEATEHFFVEWHSAPLRKKLQGLIKKLLSWAGIGTYGSHRNIYFSARSTKQLDGRQNIGNPTHRPDQPDKK